MTIHRELFNDLPSAEELEKGFGSAFSLAHNADGYYNLVQEIAARYGNEAYRIAESIFQEFGLDWDPQVLRTPETVRRVNYNFDGPNIYAITVRGFRPEDTKEIIRLYNQQYRLLGKEALLTQEEFSETILPTLDEGFMMACDEGEAVVGFVHCVVINLRASIEILMYGSGLIYNPVRNALAQAVQSYIKAKGAASLEILGGRVLYPFYKVCGKDCLSVIEQKLPHIGAGLVQISRQRS